MNISLEDFNALSAERSRREVKIATLKMELQTQAAKYNDLTADLLKERDALLDEVLLLREQNNMLRADYENVRFENHWMKQYILLSVERVREFFSHIRDFTLLSAIKSFVMDMLPPNATPEQVAHTREVMQLPLTDETPKMVNVSGDYVVEKTVGNAVGYVMPGATGISVNDKENDA
jgi:hypothetical protein